MKKTRHFRSTKIKMRREREREKTNEIEKKSYDFTSFSFYSLDWKTRSISNYNMIIYSH